MLDTHESNDDRLARRRARRWNRRARIFAPFLAVPAMLGVLLLSVNLIEHRPDGSREEASSNRRTPALHAADHRPARAPSAPIERDAVGASVDPHALSQASVIAGAVGVDMPLATGVERTGPGTALVGVPTSTLDGVGER